MVFRNMQISFKDYATINLKYLVRKQKLRLVLFPIIFLGVIFSNLYNASNQPFLGDGAGWEAVALYLVSAVVVVALVIFFIRRGWQIRYEKTQFLQSPATYTFSETGISIDSPTTQGVTSWDTIDTLLVMKELALLTTRNFTVYFLDFRCLAAPATKADFLALMQRHKVPVK